MLPLICKWKMLFERKLCPFKWWGRPVAEFRWVESADLPWDKKWNRHNFLVDTFDSFHKITALFFPLEHQMRKWTEKTALLPKNSSPFSVLLYYLMTSLYKNGKWEVKAQRTIPRWTMTPCPGYSLWQSNFEIISVSLLAKVKKAVSPTNNLRNSISFPLLDPWHQRWIINSIFHSDTTVHFTPVK